MFGNSPSEITDEQIFTYQRFLLQKIHQSFKPIIKNLDNE